VYEGEQEGPTKVAHILISKSIRTTFCDFFPSPEKSKKNQTANPYQSIISWFSKGNTIDILTDLSFDEYQKVLNKIPGLRELVIKYHPKVTGKDQLLFMEFALHGLAEFSLLSKFKLESGIQFKDMLSSMFTMSAEEEEDESDDFYK
jgi:magnesium chelatase subunit I